MRKKLLFIGVLLAILICGFLTGVALAAYEYYFPVTATDNSSSARTYYPLMLGMNGQTFIDNGKIDTDGLDTNMQSSTTNLKYLISTTNMCAVVPNFPANGDATVDFYTGYSPVQTAFSIAVGDNGSVSVADATNIEGDNWTITLTNIYINTDNGTDKNIVEQDGVFSVFTSSTVSENITAEFYPVDEEYKSNEDSDLDTNNSALRYLAQTFNSTATSSIKSINLKLFEGVNSNAVIEIRATDGSGEPTGAVLSTVTIPHTDIADATPGSWVQADLSPLYELTEGIVYAIQLRSSSGLSTSWRRDGGGSTYTDGTSFWSNDSGTNWTEVVGADFMFEVKYATVLTATGIANGESDITINHTTDNTSLVIDGVICDNQSGTFTLVDNSNDIVFMAGNSASYVDSIEMTVNGTQQLYLAPNTMVIGTSIPDRGSDNVSNDGTITWGINTNLTLRYGEMASSESTDADTSATSGISTPSVAMPSSWFNTSADITGLPFYDYFNDRATDAGIPVVVVYFWIIVAFAWLGFIVTVVGTKSAFVGAVVMLLILTVGSMQGVIPSWIVFACLLTDVLIIYLYSQVAR